MRRNIDRFPKDFCFKLNKEEMTQILRSQFATTSILSSKRRYNPYVYTEHGIIALAGILKSDVAAQASVEISRKKVLTFASRWELFLMILLSTTFSLEITNIVHQTNLFIKD